MHLPEYGRNIFKMVEFLQTIEDRQLRNQQARVVIDVMGNINNHLRDTDDLKHKLWDHLFIISDFKLDVDSPYPKPAPEVISPRPAPLAYPDHRVPYKHYGKYIEHMLLELREVDDNDDRAMLLGGIAKYMRNKSHEYNQEHPSNEVIVGDIRRMSDHAIEVPDDLLDNSRSDFRPQNAAGRTKNGKNKNNGAKQNNARKPMRKNY
jgi:hypothetical protein